MAEVTDADRELVERAEAVIREHGTAGKHTTGAALRTADGGVYTGVSVKAGTGQSDVHAEPVALAKAMMDGAGDFEAVAAVQYASGFSGPTRVVSACGSCREVLLEQAPGIEVVLQGADRGLEKRSIEALLPG